jgi:hypothetical protein
MINILTLLGHFIPITKIDYTFDFD